MLDLTITRIFFTDGHFSDHPFFTFLYNYGEYPAQIIAIISLILSFVPAFRSARVHTLYLFLTLVIGGFVINELVLKNHWGRPRPRQVIEFGGNHEYRPFYRPNFFSSEPCRSFACGHCTAGFYFFAFVFLGRQLNHRRMRQLGWTIALLFGGALGLARIAQGGHFFTDVIFGALIMWVTAYTLNQLLFSYARTDKEARRDPLVH